MPTAPDTRDPSLMEKIMRFAPAAAALSLALAVTGSVVWGAERDPAPRAVTLIAEGRAALAAGDTQGAIDSFEAALAVDPGYTPILNDLGDVARSENLQGKAIRYYREALARNPRDRAAIAGEGAALAERGALDQARARLAQVKELCGTAQCGDAVMLEQAIAAGPRVTVTTAEASVPDSMPQPQ